MTALYIVLGILLLIFLLLISFVKITIVYDDGLSVRAGYLFISFNLFPKKEKKTDPKDFTFEKFRKMRLKEEKARLKKEKKEKNKKKGSKPQDESKEKKPKKKKSASETVSLVKDLVLKLIGKTAGRLRADISLISIRVASSDPAVTAVEYGIVSSAVEYLLQIISELKKTRFTKDAVVSVVPDFISDSPEIRIKIRFRLRVTDIITLGFTALKEYISHKTKKSE